MITKSFFKGGLRQPYIYFTLIICSVFNIYELVLVSGIHFAVYMKIQVVYESSSEKRL